jgi:hypothetical protein
MLSIANSIAQQDNRFPGLLRCLSEMRHHRNRSLTLSRDEGGMTEALKVRGPAGAQSQPWDVR